MTAPIPLRPELLGGAIAAVQGLASVAVPLLLFMGLFGGVSLAAALWATLVCVTLTPFLRLLLGGGPALLLGPRAASLATYAGLVLQLCLASADTAGAGQSGTLSMAQLRVGLGAASLMFMLASVLVLLAGWLKLGNVFKMIPTPVTAGISNATALLLIWLAVKQVTHSTWLAGLTALVMLGTYLLWPRLQRRAQRLAVLPNVIVAVFVGLALAALIESSPARPVLSGAPFDWHWISVLLWPDLMPQATGQLLLIGLPGAVTLALVMILETFTTAGVMEVRFGVRSHPNRELLAAGCANLASALLGGLPSTASPAYSVSNWLAGGRGRGAAAASLVVSSALLLTLGPLLMAMPAGLMAGLLLMQATVLMYPPFVSRLGAMLQTRQWRTSDGQDMGFWITFAITLVGFFGSLIWACFMGLGLSCLAVLRRLSGNLTAHWTSLEHYRSRRVRSAGETEALSRLACRVGILRLTGHLFFGNSTRLMQLADELPKEAMAVVVDVSQVHDADPSGTEALNWLIQTLIGRELTVVLSGIKRTPSSALRVSLSHQPGVQHRIDLDHGLEACEDLVLINATVLAAPLLCKPLHQNQLLQELNAEDVTAVLMLGETREVGKGEALFRKDTLADGIWLLEEGHVSILAGGGTEATRLATVGPGQFIGEMGLIDGKPRSASAWADSPVRALLLDRHALAALAQRHPGAALIITRNIARELSHRVRSSSDRLSEAPSESDTVWSNSSLACSKF